MPGSQAWGASVRALVAGAGKIGRYLARDLAERGHEVAVVECDEAAVARRREEGLDPLLGDACDPKVLERAGCRESDVVVAATGDDEDNLVVCLLAKQEFAVPRVIGRVNHPTNAWLFDDAWGVDVAVSPPHLLTALVEEDVTVGDLVSLLRLERGRVELLEVRLDARSPAAGVRVSDLELPSAVSLVAVVRDGHVTPCRGATPLEVGDEVLVLASAERHEAVRALLVGRPRDRPAPGRAQA